MAIADCERAIAADQNCAKAYARKGYYHFMMKEYFRARECYERALRIDEKNTEARAGIERLELTLSKQKGQPPDEQQIQRALAVPEIRRVIQDPVMQEVLKQLQENPSLANKFLNDPQIREGLHRLRDAGIVRF
jgi:stress-induced-phosphoprotein 1